MNNKSFYFGSYTKHVQSWCDVNLGHGDNVGDNTMGLESPEMGSGTSETGLNFIGDANSSGSPHDVVCRP